MKGDSESASGQEQAIKGFQRDYLGKQKDGQTISHILAEVGDSLRIQKVFTNLMGNAVKFTPDGGKIRLSITENPPIRPESDVSNLSLRITASA